ncbi:PorV/PorQ family protein [candidate division KSB1 bacterium]
MKKLLTILPAVLIIVILTGEIKAQDDLSGYAAPFIRMELGARGLALGGALTASDPDGASFYYNPAALPFLEQKTLLFSYRQLSLDRFFRVISISLPLKPTGGFSAAWISSGVDNIMGRDFTGNITESIDYSENAFYFSFGINPSEKVGIGISGKILRSKIYTLTSNAFAIDLGILLKPVNDLIIGIQAKDLNGKYPWDSNSIYERGTKTYDKLPKILNIGVNYKYKYFKTDLYAGATFYSTTGKVLRIGIEKEVIENLTLRSGLFNKSFSGGIGIKFSMLKKGGFIDYAYVSVKNDPSVNHVFSVRVSF